MLRSDSLTRKLLLVDFLLEECESEGNFIEEPSEDEISKWTEEEIRLYFASNGATKPSNSNLEPPTDHLVEPEQIAFNQPSKNEWRKWFPGLIRSGTWAETQKGAILCFHNAGNAEDMYTSEGTGQRRNTSPLLEWCRRSGFMCLAPQLAGRLLRRNDPMITNAKEAAREIFTVSAHCLKTTPYAVVAHSMGCWVAYEFLIHARQQGLPMPKVAFLSGMPSPNIEFAKRPWNQQHLLNEEEFKNECRCWDINESIFDPSMWKQYEQFLRSDFTVFDSYEWRHEAESPFDFPLETFWGVHDRRVTEEMVQGWSEFTKGNFDCSPIEGNHLWPLERDSKMHWLKKVVKKLDSIYFLNS